MTELLRTATAEPVARSTDANPSQPSALATGTDSLLHFPDEIDEIDDAGSKNAPEVRHSSLLSRAALFVEHDCLGPANAPMAFAERKMNASLARASVGIDYGFPDPLLAPFARSMRERPIGAVPI